MRKFINRMKEERTPHERRQFSLRVASIMTAIIFVGWLATLGVRLAGIEETPVVQNNGSNTASTLIAVQELDGAGSNVETVGWFDFKTLFGF